VLRFLCERTGARLFLEVIFECVNPEGMQDRVLIECVKQERRVGGGGDVPSFLARTRSVSKRGLFKSSRLRVEGWGRRTATCRDDHGQGQL